MRFRRWMSTPLLAVLVAFFQLTISTPAAAAPAYAIAATNVTMPMSGNGSSSWTVTGTPMTGTLWVTCQYTGPATDAKIPQCGGGPVAGIQVNEGQTYSGTVTFYPYGSAIPLDRQKASRIGPSTAIVSLAGVFLFGFGFRRQFRGRFSALLLAICAFAILLAISACGGNSNGMTSGTYPYTITAGNQSGNGGNTSPVQEVSTTVNATVP